MATQQEAKLGTPNIGKERQSDKRSVKVECVRNMGQVCIFWDCELPPEEFKGVVGGLQKKVDWLNPYGDRKVRGRINSCVICLTPSPHEGLKPQATIQMAIKDCSDNSLTAILQIASKTSRGVEIPSVEKVRKDIQAQMATRRK